MDIQDTKERIDALLAQHERRIGAVFRAAIQNVTEPLDLDRIADLIQKGQLEEALLIPQQIAAQLGVAAQTAFIGAGLSTASWLTSSGLGAILFDQVNERAVGAMRNNTLRLVNEFTAEQRRATKVALLDGIERGLNPREQARAFRSSIGLTERQMRAVLNYRRALERVGREGVPRGEQAEALKRALRDARSDRSVKRAMRQMIPLPADQIDNMVERYRKRYIKYRSEVIARTEALRSVNEGVEEAFRQGVEQGSWELTDLERTWDSSGDARVRNSHRYLNGQKKPFGEPWRTSNGVIRYPGDPNAPASETVQCRCVLLTRVKRSSLVGTLSAAQRG